MGRPSARLDPGCVERCIHALFTASCCARRRWLGRVPTTRRCPRSPPRGRHRGSWLPCHGQAGLHVRVNHRGGAPLIGITRFMAEVWSALVTLSSRGINGPARKVLRPQPPGTETSPDKLSIVGLTSSVLAPTPRHMNASWARSPSTVGTVRMQKSMPGAEARACLAPLPYTLLETHHVVVRHVNLRSDRQH